MFRKDPPPRQTPRITIIRSNPPPPRTGTITIISRNPPASVDSPRVEEPVTNPNLGHGMTISHQTIPNVCSICRTRGHIEHNTSGSGKWKCTVCGFTFD